jgi:RNA polymerase-associated protein CTR9
MALVHLHVMLAHLHLALARTAPKVSLPHASESSIEHYSHICNLTVSLEYDKLSSDLRTKEAHYTEAAANLNRADGALQASGAMADEEPVTLAMGKSGSSP